MGSTYFTSALANSSAASYEKPRSDVGHKYTDETVNSSINPSDAEYEMFRYN